METPEYYKQADETFMSIKTAFGPVPFNDESYHASWLPAYSFEMIKQDKYLAKIIKHADETWDFDSKDMVMMKISYAIFDIASKEQMDILMKMQQSGFKRAIKTGEAHESMKEFVEHFNWEDELEGYVEEIMGSDDEELKSVKKLFMAIQKMLTHFMPDKVSNFIVNNFIFNGMMPPASKYWNYDHASTANVLVTGLLMNMKRKEE